MTDLDKLIEAVERGGAMTPQAFIGTGNALLEKHATDAWLAMANSLDAAHALHKAVLPGHWYLISGDETAHVRVGFGDFEYAMAEADTPARAWLLAILRAMKEQETA